MGVRFQLGSMTPEIKPVSATVQLFGNEEAFGLKCSGIELLDFHGFVGISLHVGGMAIGNPEERFPVGPAIHSAGIFLSYSGSRSHALREPGALYESLYNSTYGDNWKTGLLEQHRERYALHEVFDLAVGDLGWIIFLVDAPAARSRLLVGRRDSGYIKSVGIVAGEVEAVLNNFLARVQQAPSTVKTRH